MAPVRIYVRNACVCTHDSLCVCVGLCMCVYMRVCMRLCECVCVCVCEEGPGRAVLDTALNKMNYCAFSG